MCYGPRGRKESDMTEQLNCTEVNMIRPECMRDNAGMFCFFEFP